MFIFRPNLLQKSANTHKSKALKKLCLPDFFKSDQNIQGFQKSENIMLSL